VNKYLRVGIFIGMISYHIIHSLMEKDNIFVANKINWVEHPEKIQYCESLSSKFRYQQWNVFINFYSRPNFLFQNKKRISELKETLKQIKSNNNASRSKTRKVHNEQGPESNSMGSED
jgi:hypothetical protein